MKVVLKLCQRKRFFAQDEKKTSTFKRKNLHLASVMHQFWEYQMWRCFVPVPVWNQNWTSCESGSKIVLKTTFFTPVKNKFLVPEKTLHLVPVWNVFFYTSTSFAHKKIRFLPVISHWDYNKVYLRYYNVPKLFFN